MGFTFHEKETELLRKWANDPKRKPKYYTLIGDTGIGKKTILRNIFKDWDICEFGPDNKKNEIIEFLAKKVNTVSFDKFFTGFSKIAIIIEDTDKTLGETKYYKEAIKLSEKSKYPIVFVSQKKKRSYKNIIELKCPPTLDLLDFLKEKCEGQLSDDTLLEIVKECRSDIRKCISIVEITLLDKKCGLKGIGYSDSFNISKDAINEILSSDYTIQKNTHICENDFQNISEMLFYNIPNTVDPEKWEQTYEYVSFGDTLLNKISCGYKWELIGPFISVSCCKVLENINRKKKIKPTKLSIPYIQYKFPRDTISFLYTFKYITARCLLEEKRVVFPFGYTLDKALFVKLYRMLFKKSLKKEERKTVEDVLQGS